MSELKVYVHPLKTNILGQTIVGQSYYLKSESDKVIAEKDEEIAELKMKLAAVQQVFQLNQPKALFSNLETMGRLRHAIDVIERRERHQKYKRCLAMARWCNDRSDILFENTLSVRDMGFEPSDELTFKLEFFRKWHKRWLELAEKFKEVK